MLARNIRNQPYIMETWKSEKNVMLHIIKHYIGSTSVVAACPDEESGRDADLLIMMKSKIPTDDLIAH
ncbi:hypothetical protein ETR_20602, partial [Erwinia tracheiphila PSU-1]|uniref:hypothetical protein n=1 Tax=Erwinia tracheiphila TaxID=65700 RepID=UPI0003380B12